jgi:hypothetical protein
MFKNEDEQARQEKHAHMRIEMDDDGKDSDAEVTFGELCRRVGKHHRDFILKAALSRGVVTVDLLTTMGLSGWEAAVALKYLEITGDIVRVEAWTINLPDDEYEGDEETGGGRHRPAPSEPLRPDDRRDGGCFYA